jgi:hypothetical protein
MVGNYEKATLANIETARKIFWRDTMIPLLDKVAGMLNMQLAYEFGPEYRIRYDLSQVDALQENFTEKVSNAQGLWSMGLPWNEINRRLEMGFEDVDGGEIGYLPAGLLPTTFDDVSTETSTVDSVAIPGAAQVQETALNGAQVTSLLEIVNMVAASQLPEDSARGVISAAFPALSETQINEMLRGLRNFTPAQFEETLKSLGVRVAQKKSSKSEMGAIDPFLAHALAYGKKERKQENIPPQGAREEAQRGLDWRSEYGRGGTEVGIARARDISNGVNLSNETIGRMVSYFARHEVDKQGEGWNPGEEGYPSNGRIAWALWGGDAGKSWADKRLAQIQDE